MRYNINGAQKYHGLGPLKTVTLDEARVLVSDKQRDIHAVRRGRAGAIDPATKAKQERAARKAAAVKVPTFRECAEQYIEAHGKAWISDVHRGQWGQTLRDYAYLKMGNLPVNEIDRERVLQVLRPIWNTIGETARRLRGRIEKILDYAEVNGWRPSDSNPARQAPIHLALGAQEGEKGKFPALPYQQMPEFMFDLRNRSSRSARALEFLIMTATRPGEVVDAKWREIDWSSRIWTIPKERTGRKGKRGKRKAHIVPLSPIALGLLRRLFERRSGEL